MKTFNYNKFKKEAFYQDAGDLVKRQTRHLMDCYKIKLDSGMELHEAIESCIAEYQDPSAFEHFPKKMKE